MPFKVTNKKEFQKKLLEIIIKKKNLVKSSQESGVSKNT